MIYNRPFFIIPFKVVSTCGSLTSILYFLLIGTYKKTDGSGFFTVDILYAYDLKTKVVRFIKGQTRENVLSVLKKS